MTTASELSPTPSPPNPRLSPAFNVGIRRRHDEAAPIEQVLIHARTIASARHAVRLTYPDMVILSIERV